jgi:hypothetical protein
MTGALRPAVAQTVPFPGAGDTLQISATGRDGRRALVMQITLKELTSDGGLVAQGRVRFSPSLCVAAYRVRFTYTTNRGRRQSYPYPGRMRSGRLDGVAERCPFAGLPRRGLKSVRVRAVIDGRPLLHFRARPAGRPGDPFGWLKMPELVFRRPNTPQGLVSVVIRATYDSRSSHTVAFVADTDIALPRR